MVKIKVFGGAAEHNHQTGNLAQRINEWQEETGANIISVDTKMNKTCSLVTVLYNHVSKREKLTEKIE